MKPQRAGWWGAAGLLAVLLLGVTLAFTLNGYWVFVLANVALLALVGVGLNVLLGLTGQVSFGHVGFYAIGAYTVAILTGAAGLSFWLAWPLALLLGGAVGLALALPALRVKGPYLAMVTIAFGFVVEQGIVEMPSLTGGQNGLMGIAPPSLGALAQGERAVAVLAVLAACIALAGYALLQRGTWGAAMRAVRDSETAAEAIGLNPLVIKTVAFGLSAACAAAAGGLFAPMQGMVTPHTFGFSQSILFVLVVMLGGAGSVAGPVVGALVVGVLPELLASLEAYRLLFFGALLLGVLWVAPDGLAGALLRWRLYWAGRRRHGAGAAEAVDIARGTGAAQAALPTARDPAAEAAAAAGAKQPARPPVHAPVPTRARLPLSADGLCMQFGGVHAVAGLGFAAPPGCVTSLIGPNGAGKTTALNLLSGYYRPTAGQFTLDSQGLAGRSALHIARSGVARTYQTSQLFGSLSVQHNLVLAMARGRLGGLLGRDRLHATHLAQRAQALLAWCGYTGAPDALAADLPHVDRRLVEIARALATDPEVLLLDEPAAGLSREDKAALATLLRRIADAGISVLLVEHDMPLVMGISDHIVVLDAGQPLAAGTPAAVQADPAVRRAYLGEAADPAEPQASPSASPAPSAARQAPELLGVNALVTGYGAEPVLHGVDLQVRSGEAVALLGANGAGKSTLMRALAGLHRPVRGGMQLGGHDLGPLGAEQVVALGMVLVPEGRQVFAELSVLDNIRLGAFTQVEGREARVEAMLQRFPRLRERLHQRAGLLSGGEQQMLAIARGLMSKPRLLLLDEPSLGLAPKVIAELFAALDQLRREGLTLLLVDQMAGLALALADRAYVIEGGRIVAQGSGAEIAADATLAHAYLGEAPVAATDESP